MNKITIGIDISKKKFDACMALPESGSQKWKRGTFDNSPDGFKAFEAWFKQDSTTKVHAVMEATGRYGEDLAHFLYEAGYEVSVVNPAQIKYYGRSLLRRSKTDKIDSQLIAQFAQRHDIKLWKPLAQAHQAVKEHVRCLEAFKADETQTSNRLSQAKDACVKALLEERLSQIKAQITYLQKTIQQMIKKDPDLQEIVLLLTSIPGIGETTAWNLLAELPDLGTFACAKQLAAYAGLNPSIRTSGTSVKGRESLSRMGNSTLRKILYFPALSLMRASSTLRPFIERLRTRGKIGKVIVAAIMHKLIRIIFGVLKKQRLFLPYEAKIQPA